MSIAWNEDKNKQLKKERGVSFEDLICDGDLVDVIENKTRKGQKNLVILYRDYIYAIPFLEEDNGIFLKTLYPCRKLRKKYK